MLSYDSEHWIPTDKFRESLPTRLAPPNPSAIGSISPFSLLDLPVRPSNRGTFNISSPAAFFQLGFPVVSSPMILSRRDFVDVTTGANVVLEFTTPAIVAQDWSWLGRFLRSLAFAHDPNDDRQKRAVEPVFRSRHENDGTCWEIDGHSGSLAVMLSDATSPTAIAVYQPIQHQLSPRTAAMAPRHLAPVSQFLVSGRVIPNHIGSRRRPPFV
ncbi:hypothetical protein BDZ89DRAFT_1147446 [Hymenopellis radicata]|nr:hypothetical protein BDZ89DRAFT_1147446 [Hymenopellis radicata]